MPEALRSECGGWESQELKEMFQQYAEFAFQKFGALAHSWVTLSDLNGVLHDGQPAGVAICLQNILKLNKKIDHLYHQRFPDRGKKD